MLRLRLHRAGRAAAQVIGLTRTLSRLYEDPRVFVTQVAPYAVVVLILGIGAATGPVAVPELTAFAMAGPLFAAGVLVSTVAPLVWGRFVYRHRVRPHLLAEPPARSGQPARCRVCLAPLSTTAVGPFLRCRYCGTESLVDDDRARADAERLSSRIQFRRERLAAARREILRIERLGKLAMPAALVTTWLAVMTLIAWAATST